MGTREPLEITPIWEGHAIRVTVEHVVGGDGRRRAMDVVRHPGAAAVVPIDGDGQVLMVRQWRQPSASMLLELPAGRVDPGESGRAAAARELREEVGMSARRWTDLGEVLTSPGFLDEKVSLFLAEELEFVGLAPDEGEEIEQVRMPWAEAHAQALGGALTDAKTVCGLARAQAVLAGRRRGGAPR